MRVYLGSLGFGFLLVSVAAAGPFDGLYSPKMLEGEAWDCKSVGMDGGALSIKDDVFEGVESQCKLTNPRQFDGFDAVLYDAECTGEGETYTLPTLMVKTVDGVAVIQEGYVSELVACPM